MKTLYEPTANDLGDADLMLYMGFRDANYYSGGGFASQGVVCGSSYRSRKQTKFSANFYGSSFSRVGESMAHEVGHNLGMEHDFDRRHGGFGNPCNKKGFMSYGSHQSRWSECSVKDFTALYTFEMQNGVHKWCLPRKLFTLLYYNPCFLRRLIIPNGCFDAYEVKVNKEIF